MEPILSKEEISELLSAIKAGSVAIDTVEGEFAATSRRLPTQEVDLLQTYHRVEDGSGMRIPNFDIIMDTFSRNFSTSLTNTLQRTFTVEREEITTATFQQSLIDLNNQGAVGIYSTDPLKYGCLFHFDTLLAFNLLEIMLGSSSTSEAIALDRNLTTIEINILKNTMTGICNDLKKAFQPIITLDPKLSKAENNFRLVNIVDPETEVLVIKFNIKVSGDQSGSLRMIIPYPTVEPLREQFKEIVTVTQTAYNWSEIFADEALEMSSQVIARSGMIDMSIRDILQLQIGDLIYLEYDPDQPLTIVVEDKPKYFGVPGERSGKKAFHVTGRFSNRLGEFHGNT